MATINLNGDSFNETLEKSSTILIDFWAEWCGPCKRFAPVYEQVSEKYPDVVFAKVDTEANPEISSGLEISAIPTLMIIKDGILLYREAGALNAKQLESLVDEVVELDTEELKRHMAEHEADEATSEQAAVADAQAIVSEAEAEAADAAADAAVAAGDPDAEGLESQAVIAEAQALVAEAEAKQAAKAADKA